MVQSSIILFLILLTLSSAQNEEIRTLEPGQPVQRTLTAGEAHLYRVMLASGEYARVSVNEQSIDIALAAVDPDGKTIVERDVARSGEAEYVSLVAETSATYRLEVRSSNRTAPEGQYEIKIAERRAATDEDHNHVAGEKLAGDAMRLYHQGTADSRRNAIEKYQQTITHWQAAKDAFEEVNALYMIGQIWIDLGEKQKALDSGNQALLVARTAGHRTGEGYALDTIGRAYDSTGDKKKALELYNQALQIRQEAGDKHAEAFTLNNIATAHGWLGEWPEAIDSFNRVRVVLRALGDRLNEAIVLSNMCLIHNNLGRYKDALDFCEQSIALSRQVKNSGGEATALDLSGRVYSNLGRYQEALDLHNEAYEIHKALGLSRSQAIVLNNVAGVYASLGEYQKAIDFYNQTLEVFRTLGDQYRQASTLGDIGINYANLGEYQKALAIHLQVLPIRQAVGDLAGESLTLSNIASCYSNLGDNQNASDYYSKALAIQRTVGNRQQMAVTLKNAGAFYRDLGDRVKALDYLNEGLEVNRAIGEPKVEAGILADIARLERDRGNLMLAQDRIEEALAAVESLRINVKSHELRASFFASVRQYHEFYIDLLMRLDKQRPSVGFAAAALQASEKARARSLLELLAEARAEIRRDIDPALIERERNIRIRITDKAESQTRLLSGEHTEDQVMAAATELDALTTEYEQVQARIRQTSPHYAALTQPVPLTLKEIQSNVLDHETLLLEYALGEEKSFLWAVTPTSIRSFELPKRSEIERVAQRFYEILTARNKEVPNESPRQRRNRLEQAEAEYPKISAELSRMVLGAVAAELQNKRLLIVSEGVLQYIPFGTLQNPGATDSRPLIVDHEIVSLPSASVMSVLRGETAAREIPGKTLAVFADPVFDKNDARVARLNKDRTTGVGESDSSWINRSATESGLRDFVRLRFSREEADQITRFVPEGKRLKALDFAASRTTATSPELEQYAILHFATHALINHQHPELAGVVLSLVDEQGRPQNGFLRLYDIYNLNLRADLVVLSACQTALGKDIKGEGLLGLTRGFMYAGAPRVVASLWQIDDRATAEFMKRFYEEMLAKGLRPAAALRAAQVSMWKETRWADPYSWAAFTLQGEWK